MNSTSFDKRLANTTITAGKKWTLLTSKEDETNPGPVYETQYLRSINYGIDHSPHKVKGCFGISREETIDKRIFFKGRSPGPSKYYCDYTGKRIKLSNTKHANEFTMPKCDRGLLNRTVKVDGPNP